jgi:hypothetical protein
MLCCRPSDVFAANYAISHSKSSLDLCLTARRASGRGCISIRHVPDAS